MDINSIILSGVSLGGMGLLFGAGLAFASQKFAVEVDERVTQILDVLPGANCGGCGYPGCGGFANGVVAGDAPVSGCPVGGPDCTAAIAQIMGMEASAGNKMIARVLCAGTKEQCKDKYEYNGIYDCVAATQLAGGPKSCKFGCMGLGTCERVCPFDAIHVNDQGVAVVDEEKCTACNKCVIECPKNIIQLIPYSQFVVVDCMNYERGGHVKKNCGVACIACGACERACPFDAIHVNDNLASIDYDKCTNCGICVKACPTNAIWQEEDGARVKMKRALKKPKKKAKPVKDDGDKADAKAAKPAKPESPETDKKLN